MIETTFRDKLSLLFASGLRTLCSQGSLISALQMDSLQLFLCRRVSSPFTLFNMFP